jgi:hypothetical protein
MNSNGIEVEIKSFSMTNSQERHEKQKTRKNDT